jgi:hypothetical protein
MQTSGPPPGGPGQDRPASAPAERAYYYVQELDDGPDVVVALFIPPDELQRRIADRTAAPRALDDFPSGLEILVDDQTFVDYGLQRALPKPAVIHAAISGLIRNTHPDSARAAVGEWFDAEAVEALAQEMSRSDPRFRPAPWRRPEMANAAVFLLVAALSGFLVPPLWSAREKAHGANFGDAIRYLRAPAAQPSPAAVDWGVRTLDTAFTKSTPPATAMREHDAKTLVEALKDGIPLADGDVPQPASDWATGVLLKAYARGEPVPKGVAERDLVTLMAAVGGGPAPPADARQLETAAQVLEAAQHPRSEFSWSTWAAAALTPTVLLLAGAYVIHVRRLRRELRALAKVVESELAGARIAGSRGAGPRADLLSDLLCALERKG